MTEIIAGEGAAAKTRSRAKKTVFNISPASRRRPPPVRRRKGIEVIPPVPMDAQQKFEAAQESAKPTKDGDVYDNVRSSTKKSQTQFKNKHSTFLITYNPNSAVDEALNPKLFNAVKNEIKSFAQFILDPKNADVVLKPAPGNVDPDWSKKIIGYSDSKVASLERGDRNKQLHTHIYLPIEHKTKVHVNIENIKEVARLMMHEIGVDLEPHINCKIVFGEGLLGARDYVLKQAEQLI